MTTEYNNHFCRILVLSIRPNIRHYRHRSRGRNLWPEGNSNCTDLYTLFHKILLCKLWRNFQNVNSAKNAFVFNYHQLWGVKQFTFVASFPYPTGSTSVYACPVDLVTAFFIVTVTAFGFTVWPIPTGLTALKTKPMGNSILIWWCQLKQFNSFRWTQHWFNMCMHFILVVGTIYHYITYLIITLLSLLIFRCLQMH